LYDKLGERQDSGQPIGRYMILASVSIEEAPVIMKEWDHAPEGTPVEEIVGLLNRTKETIRRQRIIQRIAEAETAEIKRSLMEQLQRKEGI
jgi:hypothetical protein